MRKLFRFVVDDQTAFSGTDSQFRAVAETGLVPHGLNMLFHRPDRHEEFFGNRRIRFSRHHRDGCLLALGRGDGQRAHPHHQRPLMPIFLSNST